MLETPIAQPSPAPSGKEKSPYQADRLRGVKEARTAIEVLKVKWPAIFNDPKTIKPLASPVLSQVAAALGWSLGYTRGVFHVWKSRNDYCRAVLRVCRAAMPALRVNGGHIVNISGLAGVVALPFAAHYSASKFAVEGLSESLRLEARSFGVKVALVEPGYTRTSLKDKRRIAGASRNGVYASAFDKFLHKNDEMRAAAISPGAVAALVEGILNDPHPKTRYTIGRFKQRLIPPLKRILPQRMFEWVLRRSIGV